MWLLRCTGWWILDYAYAGWRQLRSLVSRSRAADFRAGDRLPVLVLPGVYEHWRFMRRLVEAIHRRGHPVHAIDALGLNLLPIDEAADAVVDYLDENGLERVVVLAHSKGGLIGKALMSRASDGARIVRMIAICTPFSGSRYASRTRVRSLRIFSANDPVLRALMENASAHARITSIAGVFDPHIPEGSELVGARNVRLNTGGHFRIHGLPETVAAVLGELEELEINEARGSGRDPRTDPVRPGSG